MGEVDYWRWIISLSRIIRILGCDKTPVTDSIQIICDI